MKCVCVCERDGGGTMIWPILNMSVSGAAFSSAESVWTFLCCAE